MEVAELKDKILTKKLSDDFLILQYTDNDFIAKQYVTRIASNNKQEIEYVDSLYNEAAATLSLVMDQNSTLKVLCTDTFDELLGAYYDYTNYIVICKSIDNKIKQEVLDYVVVIPALADWQVKEYIKATCQWLPVHEVDELYKRTSGNIYQIDSELSKISLFGAEDQIKVINELFFGPGKYLFNMGNFDLTNAIEKKDMQVLNNYYLYKDCISLYKDTKYENDPSLVFINTLLQSFKNKALVINTNLPAAKLYDTKGKPVSSGSYYHLKNDRWPYSNEALENIIAFLSDLACKIPTGQLEIDFDDLVDYIIINILGCR